MKFLRRAGAVKIDRDAIAADKELQYATDKVSVNENLPRRSDKTRAVHNKTRLYSWIWKRSVVAMIGVVELGIEPVLLDDIDVSVPTNHRLNVTTANRREYPFAVDVMAGGTRVFVVGLVGIILAATLLGGCGDASTSTGSAQLISITIPAASGDVDSKWLSYPDPPRANVLLPAGYNPQKRYPLVVFLNGLGLNYNSYAEYGLTKPFEDQGAIVVMPEGGNGWYTDWWNDGERGGPSWESYELETVLPTILARYPILPERRYHALIGISMGGLGATYLGGRLPGFFGSVAALSGFVDPQWNAAGTQAAMAIFSQAAENGATSPYPIYGPPDGFYASGHNPTLLAKNLEFTRVFVSTGTGVPSTSDPDPGDFPITEEKIIYPMSESYYPALMAAGVDVTYQVHPGAHGIPDFLDEIDAMLEWGLFEPVPAEPPAWENDTVATSGQLWDFNYRFAQPPSQIVTFERSGSSLSISDAGSDVTITTGSGCAVHTSTPATVILPDSKPISPSEPERVGTTACS